MALLIYLVELTIGSDSDNRVEITPTSMQIVLRGGITMDSNGNATFNLQ